VSDAHPATLPEKALLAQCTMDRGRTSGPGGQHRNKVETWIGLTHKPTGVVGQAGERRSQADNKRVALFRLRLALATEVRTDAGLSDTPTPLWRSRLRGTKISCNAKHADYPALLAEALDHIEAGALDPRPGAAILGCSQSQLIKFVQKHPPAFTRWNARRQERGLRTLR